MQTPGVDEQMLDQITDVAAGRADLLARYAGQRLARHDTGPDAKSHGSLSVGIRIVETHLWHISAKLVVTTQTGIRKRTASS